MLFEDYSRYFLGRIMSIGLEPTTFRLMSFLPFKPCFLYLAEILIIAKRIIVTSFHYLKTYRSHLDSHCLGVLFSNKAFPSRVLGLAWKGDPKKQSGICQKRRKEVHLKNYKDSSDLNLNSLFITLRTKSMQRIPLRFVEAWLRNWRLV